MGRKRLTDKEKTVKQFIGYYKNSISDTVQRMNKAGILISYMTGRRLYNTPEVFERISDKMGDVTKAEGVKILGDLMRSDVPSKTAKTKMDAFEKLSKALGWNEEKGDNKVEIVIKKDWDENRTAL